MKYTFNVATDHEKREQHLELLKKKAELMMKKRRAGHAIDMVEYKEILNKIKQLTRIDNSYHSVLFFAYEYFSYDMNPDFDDVLIPKGFGIDDAASFHVDLTNVLDKLVANDEGSKIAWASPRGSGKSMYLSNIFLIHRLIFGGDDQRYLMIISETDNMARKFVEYAANTLKFNGKLRDDFGNLLDPKAQHNEKDNQESFITKNGKYVEAASMGKQLRGRRYLSHRPTTVLLDDIESSKNTNTPDLREKNLHWFNSVVLPMISANGDIIYMGTLVHQDGLLNNVLKRADFESRVYSSIISPPERQDLWDEFEKILRNEQDDDRLDKAMALYYDNQEEMDKVEVLWKDRMPYYKLMIQKTQMTSRSFSSEYLNNPTDLESQLFKKDHMTWFDYGDITKLKGKLDYYGSWDIAMGKSSRSDYNAIVILGRDRTTGVVYVVETWAEKCMAHKAVIKAADLIQKYRPKKFAIETVQAQFDLYRQLLDMLNKRGYYHTKLVPITTNKSHGKKEDRIEQLEPLIINGTLRFMKHQHLLIEQLEMFPTGTHDDLPDATVMALDLCSFGARRRAWHKKPKGI